MTKKELIDAISDAAGLPKTVAEKALNAFVSSITKALKKGDTVGLTGFGRFAVTKRKARKGRNPQTGAEITIKASNSPTFKAGKGLKEAVN